MDFFQKQTNDSSFQNIYCATSFYVKIIKWIIPLECIWLNESFLMTNGEIVSAEHVGVSLSDQ